MSSATQTGEDAAVAHGLPAENPEAARAAPSVVPGNVLGGRYRLHGALGRGANGLVFEAEDLHLDGERVALKLLLRRDPEGIYRLKNEFRALAELHHPNLVGLRALERHDEQWFIVMDLVRGVDFAEYVGTAGRALDASRLRRALGGLVAGIAALHKEGKVHGDLKPSNVLVREDGQVLLVDFGLVSDALDQVGHDRRRIAGTMAYLAPEQALGEPPSAASDLYALGVMLYEVLTGELPFDGPTALVDKTCMDAPGVAASGDSADLAELCGLLLARDPETRPLTQTLLALLGADTAGVRQASPTLPFVGRSSELSQLERAFAQRKAEAPAGVVITGASGVGKTALLDVFARTLRARDGAIVLRGRCRAEELVPLNAFDGAIDELSRLLASKDARFAELPLPSELTALVCLFPTLARAPRIARALTLAELPPADSRTRVRALSGLLELLQRLLQVSPVVLVIDDLQWADADSLDLLGLLAHQRGLSRPWIVASARADAAPARTRWPSLLELKLPPLDEPETLLLARASHVLERMDRQASQRLLAAAQGSPFILTQLLRHFGETGEAESVSSVVRARAAFLEPKTRALLELVCGAPAPISLPVALRVAACGAQAFHQLRQKQLIRLAERGRVLRIEPYHDQIRLALGRDRAPADERDLLERLLASAQSAAEHDARLSFECLRRLGRPAEASASALEAALDAERAFALGPAGELFAYAEQHGSAEQRAKAQRALARVLANTGRVREAAERYELLSLDAEHEERVAFEKRAMLLYLQGGHEAAGHALLRKLSARLGLAYPREGSVTGPLELALLFARYRLRGELPTTLPEPHVAPREPSRPEQQLELLMLAARALAGYSHASYPSFAFRGLILTRKLRSRRHLGLALALEVTGFYGIAGKASARSDGRARRAIELAEAAGDHEIAASVRAIIGWYFLYTGQAELALAELSRAESDLEVLGQSVASVCNFARSGRLTAFHNLGDVRGLAVQRSAWLLEAEATGDVFLANNTLACAGYALLNEGAIDEARTAYQRALDVSAAASPYEAMPWWQADVELFAGAPERALAWFERAERSTFHRTIRAMPMLRALSDFALLRVALSPTGQGNLVSRSAFQRARRALSRVRCPNAVAMTLLIEGALCAREQNQGGALAHLERAERLASELGMLLVRDAAQYQRAVLTRDASLSQQALAALCARGLAEPERWVAMIAPGFT